MRAVALAGLAAWTACWASPPPATVGAAPTRPRATSPFAKTIADPLGFLPADGHIVVRLDLDRARETALWQHYGPAIVAATAPSECFAKIAERMTSWTYTVTSLDPKRSVSVLRGVDAGGLRACIAEEAPDHLAREEHGDLSVWQLATMSVGFAAPDARTAIIVLADDVTVDALRAIERGGSPLRTQAPELLAMFDELAGAHARFVVAAPDYLANLAMFGGKPVAFLGRATIVDDLEVQVRMRYEDATAATATLPTTQSYGQKLATMLDRFDAAVEDRDVVVTARLGDDKLGQLLSIWGIRATP